jgi:uncharacterized protein (TIGR02266 family)
MPEVEQMPQQEAPSSNPEAGREHPRIEAVFRVEYATMDHLVVAYSSDLSKGGLFVTTQGFLPVNAVVRLMLQLPEGGGEIPVICRVVYVRDQAEGPAKPPGMGLEFLDIADDCRVRIERFIASQPPKLDDFLEPAKRALSILLVDDDRLSLQAAADCFRERGDRVLTATNGLDALAACLKEPPDVILSDVQMPKMDGWQLVRMVRARPTLSSIPLIFLTTLSGEPERLRAYRLGVDDFLAKPCQPALLRTRVDRIMTRLGQRSRSALRDKTLRGDLEQVSLPSVLGFLELERKTGVLLLVGAGTARVFLTEGRPLRVEREAGALQTSPRALMNDLLSWRSGQFEFAAQEVGGPDELQCTLMTLLLDHARLSDESSRGG